jgi:CheY-like chemotaxis protein
MTIRVLLADDDALLRAGLAVVLGTAADLTVVAEASDGLQAVELCREHIPDVVLDGRADAGIDGIEATRRVVAALPEVRVLVLTTFQHDEYVWGCAARRRQRLPAQALPRPNACWTPSARSRPARRSSTLPSPATSSGGSWGRAHRGPRPRPR